MIDFKKFVCVFILTLLSDTYCNNIGLQNVSSRFYKNKRISDSASNTLVLNRTLRSPQRRLFGGKEVKHIKQFPYMVWITLKVQDNKSNVLTSRNSYCGGSIISKRFILTAAHCVSEIESKKLQNETKRYYFTPVEVKTLRVMTGGTSHTSFQTLSEVKKFYIQPNFKIRDEEHQCLFRSDMALLELKEPLRFNRNVKKVKLPNPVHLNKDDLNKTKTNSFANKHEFCTVLGFGSTVNYDPTPLSQRKLKFEKIKLIDSKKCTKHLKISNYGMTDYKNNGLCTDTTICSYDNKRTDGICFGDSGSPLVCGGEQLGLVSWSSGGTGECVHSHIPDIYTRVDIHVPWIRSVMKNSTKTKDKTQKK